MNRMIAQPEEGPVIDAAAPARPLVTVIVPTHNRPDSLARCVASLLVQDLPAQDYEIIVADNLTDPATQAVVERMAADAPVRLTYVPLRARGPAASRQEGAMAARGGILAFTDDDCEATPGWLAAGLAALAAAPEAGFIQGRTQPNPAHRRQVLEKTVDVPGPSEWFETCNIFYRRDAFMEAGGFTGVFAEILTGEDTDLARRVLRLGHGSGFAEDAVVYHDVTPQTLRKWIMECWRLRSIPLVVKCWPEMRRTLFLGVFLSKQSAAFDLGVLGLLLLPVTGAWALVLWLPFFFVRLFEPGRYRNPVMVVARSILGLPRSCVTFAALLTGSLRARALVL